MKRNKKKFKRSVYSFGCLIVLFLSYYSVVYAVSENGIETIGAYDLDSYASYVGDTEFSLGKMLFGANGTDFFQTIANFFFGFSKWVWQMLDFVIDKLYNGAEMNQAIHQFFLFSKNIYHELFGTLGLIGFVMTVVYLFFVYLNQPRRAVKLAKRFLFLIIFSVVWFGDYGLAPKGEEFTKKLDDISVQVEGFIFQSTAGVEQLGDGDVALSSTQAVKQIRDMYFRRTVVDSYLLMNYGTTDIEALKRAEINPTEFLSDSLTKEKGEEIVETVNEKSGEENQYRSFIQPTKGVYKATVGSIAPLTTIALGIPIVTIGLVRFIFQIGVLLCLIAIPFLAIGSFFPTFEYMIMGFLKKFLSLIFQKAFFSVLILVVFLVFNLVDKWIATNTLATLGANIFVKTVISLIAIMKRMVIMEKLGLSSATNTVKTAKKTTKQAWKETKQVAKKTNDGLVNARRKIDQAGLRAGLAVAGKVNPAVGQGVNFARTVQGKGQGFVQAKAKQNQTRQDFVSQSRNIQAKKTMGSVSNVFVQKQENHSVRSMNREQALEQGMKQGALENRVPKPFVRTLQQLPVIQKVASVKEKFKQFSFDKERIDKLSRLHSAVPLSLASIDKFPRFQAVSRKAQFSRLTVSPRMTLSRMKQNTPAKVPLSTAKVKEIQRLRKDTSKQTTLSIRNHQKPVKVAVNPNFQSKVKNSVRVTNQRTIQPKGIGGRRK